MFCFLFKLKDNIIDFAKHFGHWVIQGNAPTAVVSSTWGSTASVAVDSNSNDHRGQVTTTNGGTGEAAGATCTITFDKAYAQTPFCIVSIGGGTAHVLADPQDFTYVVSTTGIVITSLDEPGSDETVIWNYIVVG